MYCSRARSFNQSGGVTLAQSKVAELVLLFLFFFQFISFLSFGISDLGMSLQYVVHELS